MLPISAEELAGLRTHQEGAMPELVTIKRRGAQTQDGKGQFVQAAYVTVASDVPARITPSQVMMAGGQGDRALELEKWQLRFPHDTDVQDRDLIVWGTIEIEVEDVKQARSWMTAISATGEIVK
jgi:hypothetical protein